MNYVIGCSKFLLTSTLRILLVIPSHLMSLGQLGLVLNSKANDELTDAASEQRAISIAVTRKKKAATNAITNVVRGIFHSK